MRAHGCGVSRPCCGWHVAKSRLAVGSLQDPPGLIQDVSRLGNEHFRMICVQVNTGIYYIYINCYTI